MTVLTEAEAANYADLIGLSEADLYALQLDALRTANHQGVAGGVVNFAARIAAYIQLLLTKDATPTE